jgi:muramoyltetrapeptide carboxypeptidase LdcA involved in peptidoglycan recycling
VYARLPAFGHQQPHWTVPEGVMAEIDATADTIQLLESPVL